MCGFLEGKMPLSKSPFIYIVTMLYTFRVIFQAGIQIQLNCIAVHKSTCCVLCTYCKSLSDKSVC